MAGHTVGEVAVEDASEEVECDEGGKDNGHNHGRCVPVHSLRAEAQWNDPGQERVEEGDAQDLEDEVNGERREPRVAESGRRRGVHAEVEVPPAAGIRELRMGTGSSERASASCARVCCSPLKPRQVLVVVVVVVSRGGEKVGRGVEEEAGVLLHELGA